MKKITIFDYITKDEVENLMNEFDAKKMHFNKDVTIATNINNINLIGIILEGSATVVRYEYNGDRNIIEKLNKDDLFGEVFTSNSSNDLSIIATSPCDVLFIDYNMLITSSNKYSTYKNKVVDNKLQLLAFKIVSMNDRIEVLTKRTIREKLLTFFNISTRDKINKTFTMPFSFTDLADYLAIDRSAMTREIKNLKEDGIIVINDKRITLLN